MQVTKSLILFLLSTLQASDINTKTDSNSKKPIHEKIEIITGGSNATQINIRRTRFNFDIVKEIDNDLNEICKNDPTNSDGTFHNQLADIIDIYAEPTSFEFVYDKIMEKLDPLKEKREKELNSSNDNFLEELFSTINEKKDEIPGRDIFWPNFDKLLQKSIFRLREKMINATDNEFEESDRVIQNIVTLINEKINSDIPSDFSLKNMKIENFNFESLESEFTEQSEQFFLDYIKALEYFYSPTIDKEENKIQGKMEVIKKPTCEEFRAIFFKGNPYTNVLLQAFMTEYDSMKGTIKACLESGTEPTYPKIDNRSTKEEIENNSNQSKVENVERFKNLPFVDYARNLLLDFIISNKKIYMITAEVYLSILLRRMKYLDLLTKENIEAIVRFQKSGNPNQFDSKVFKSYLEENWKKYHSSRSRNFINECLELCELEPLK